MFYKCLVKYSLFLGQVVGTEDLARETVIGTGKGIVKSVLGATGHVVASVAVSTGRGAETESIGMSKRDAVAVDHMVGSENGSERENIAADIKNRGKVSRGR